MDVVKIDGRLRVVLAVHWPDGWTETESLGDTLAARLIVGTGSKTLAEVLIDAGWTPPQEAAQ